MRELLLWLLLTQPLHNSTPFYEENKMPMTTSGQGKAMIKDFEGFRERPYRDGDIFLIGYGHRILPQEKDLKICSQDKADQLFEADITQAEECLKKVMPYGLSQNQHDALISLIYSTGCGAFRSSDIYRHLQEKNFTAALQHWQKWTYNGWGISLMGLVDRRKKETDLFKA
jgi:lysozyme